ncbi:protein of unknown function [Dyella jiangningensis]|uniref:DUF4865 family protein n=1 Tax=Dyella sp. AtDHG13 TaxID=1938897 RepID=UPI00088F314B|nr:DUF4865 family protein [Dyella sp. AtDHG13]PXV53138.1 uncharacterized protein DUF4865 [Dyella sp. AtDHG13]SDL58219.1 protein of unknown function [Dyella jiangningensis]
MIAMQYSFTLPADYDMAIIRQRIADKGHLLDHFDGLLLKSYLHAQRGASSNENLYAPFYVWKDSAAMQRFLGSDGFARLTEAFGWPSIRVWPVWDAYLSPEARHARFASREIQPIAPYSALGALREQQREQLQRDVERGALAAVEAFEPTTWSRVSFRLWDEARPATSAGQWYEVGHVSQP